MSNDFKALKLKGLNENSFSRLPSKKYLNQIIQLEDQEAQIEKSAFEWLSLTESNDLYLYLQKKGASKDYQHRDGEAIKLNMLEWLSVYNMLLTDNTQFRLTDNEKNLLLKFMERFDLLIQENAIDSTMKVSYAHEQKVKTKKWNAYNNGFYAAIGISVVLILLNLFIEHAILDWIAPIAFVTAGVLIYLRENTKADVTDHVICCMYTQMLVEHSY